MSAIIIAEHHIDCFMAIKRPDRCPDLCRPLWEEGFCARDHVRKVQRLARRQVIPKPTPVVPGTIIQMNLSEFVLVNKSMQQWTDEDNQSESFEVLVDPPMQQSNDETSREAMPGVGIKMTFDSKGHRHADVVVKASRNYKCNVEQYIVIAIDCSGSMGTNGGYEGVRQMLKMASTYASNLPNNGNVLRARVIFFNGEVFKPSSKESRGFGKMSEWSSELTEHLLNTVRADGLTNIEAATREGLEILTTRVKTDPSVLRGLILMTDGQASRGMIDASNVRHLFQCYRGNDPIYMHAIAMGNSPRADWLDTYVGNDGMVGYASTLEHVGEAFERVIGKLHGIDAIFSAKVTVEREGKVIAEKTHQLGMKSSKKQTATFRVSLDDLDTYLQNDDVVSVTSMGETVTLQVGKDQAMRLDLWEEADLISSVEEEITRIKNIAKIESIEEAVSRMKIVSEKEGPAAVRERTLAAYRSLSTVCQTCHKFDEVPEVPNYRSLGIMNDEPSSKRARRGSVHDVSPSLAVLDSCSSSQF